MSVNAATLPPDWQYDQSFHLAAPGLTKISLPIETLDAARPTLEDLRVYDDAGNEVPYVIERPVPTMRIVREVKSFQATLQARNTVLLIETGLTQSLDIVTLETPALNFLKPVRIESSSDGRTWQTIAQGQPIFRQPNGANRLNVSFPSGTWAWLRLTVDDQRTGPIPITGARVHATVIETAPTEWMPVSILEGTQNPGETRLALNLGAANLSVASVQIETSDPLFTRAVTFAVPQISEAAVREQTIGQGSIHRVAVEELPLSENLSIPLETSIRSRELLLFVHNQDSPPLSIRGIRLERRPVYLAFLARESGRYHLLTGNNRCAAPRYDLASLGMNLKTVAVTPVKLAMSNNPAYLAPEVLPGVQDGSTPLDVAEWEFRKPIETSAGIAHRLKLDPDVLSRAQSSFADLRILSAGRQIPYVLEQPSIHEIHSPAVTVITDAKDPRVKRWIIRLPGTNLPVARMSCLSPTALFERQMNAYEEITDERGVKARRALGQAAWSQKPGQPKPGLTISLDGRLQTDTLILETDNGDNPPIEVENVRVFLPVTRALFKAQARDNLFLYYGNPDIARPRYDLSLVADQLLSAEKANASLGTQERLKKSRRSLGVPGSGGVLFWVVLAVVVVGLVAIISRLLPKASPPPS